MSKQIKLYWCLFSIFLNQSITDVVFFHWLKLVVLLILLLILSRMSLLILPISDLVGLIILHVGLLAKFGLWSFSVMNSSLSAVLSTLSSMPSFVAMFLFSAWMKSVVLSCAFLCFFCAFFYFFLYIYSKNVSSKNAHIISVVF